MKKRENQYVIAENADLIVIKTLESKKGSRGSDFRHIVVNFAFLIIWHLNIGEQNLNLHIYRQQ